MAIGNLLPLSHMLISNLKRNKHARPPCISHMHMQRTQRNNRTTNCCPGKEVLIATWYALARSLRMSQGRTLLTVHTEFHLSAHLHRSRRRVRVGRLRRRRHLPRGACDRYHSHGRVPHPPLCKARGEVEGARPGAACLLLVARLVCGLEAIGPKQHEAVDVPAARGGATRHYPPRRRRR